MVSHRALHLETTIVCRQTEVHQYTLICDGKVIATKKMVKQ